MKKEIFIHIGLPKTGRSTIYQSLRNNIKKFQDQGYDILLGNEIISELGNFIVTNSGKFWSKDYKCKFWNIIKEINPEVNNFELSDQKSKFFNMIERRNFHKIVISNLMLANLLAPPKSAAFGFSAKIMRDFFFKNNYKVNLILFIRNQADFMASFYQEQIKHGETESFDTFFNELCCFFKSLFSNLIGKYICSLKGAHKQK